MSKLSGSGSSQIIGGIIHEGRKVSTKMENVTSSDENNTISLTSRFRFLSWSDETFSIPEFIKTYPLPRVVRITNYEEGNVLKNLIIPPDVDITQPLLLFKKYRQIKIQAKCLKPNKSGKWKDSGSTVIIPDSFPGWFSLLSQDGRECSMMLTSLGQAAAARVPAFLTKFDISVYKLVESSETGGQSVYLRTIVKGGSVLRLLGVWADLGYQHFGDPYQAWPKRNSMNEGLGGMGGRFVGRSISHNSTTNPPQFQYVQCLSQGNEVLFIPFTATGIFYPVAPRGSRNPQQVYPLAVIARSHPLPIRVKMVAGNLPAHIPDFTGIIEIERVDTEDIILACTLLKEKPSLFELDIDCDFLLSQMTSEDLFTKSTSYQTTLSHCRLEGETWRRQVRLYSKGKGTLTGTIALKSKLNRTLRIRSSSPPPPSRLSLLFRPNSTSAFGNTKDPLKRSKSFNVEIQSVSISLTQDEEEFHQNALHGGSEEPNKRMSSIFNFMSKKDPGKGTQKCRQNPPSNFRKPDVLPSVRSTPSDVPYSRVLDELPEPDDEQNIYAEINDGFHQLNLMNMNSLQLPHTKGIPNFQRLHLHPNESNLSSLIKSGGSDGAFSSGTLSGTFSSSNPSNREDDIYDNVF